MKRILFLLIIISLAPGCIIIPLPADDLIEIDKIHKQIAVGKNTREAVISILGEPDVSRDRYILYKHKEYSGGTYFMYFIPILPFGRGCCGGEGKAGQVFMDLYFEFDNYGVLTDFRTDTYDKRLNSVKYVEETSEMEEDCDPGMESCP